MKKRPVDYFKEFYADTALFGAAPATRCGLDFFGVDRALFAFDMPFEPMLGLFPARDHQGDRESTWTPTPRKASICTNAERLLNLGPAATA